MGCDSINCFNPFCAFSKPDLPNTEVEEDTHVQLLLFTFFFPKTNNNGDI
jgi:hypothetical protein